MAEQRDAEARRIGQLIAELRLAQGWSQQDLAHEIEVGVSTVSRWERGLNRGYGSNVSKLAKALKVAPAVIRPAEPDTETQLDRIEARLEKLQTLMEKMAEDEVIAAGLRALERESRPPASGGRKKAA